MIFSAVKWFKYLFILFLVIISSNSFTYAATSLSSEEKAVFKIASNIGEISFYFSDIVSNEKIMGLNILDAKLKHLQNLVITQSSLIDELSSLKNEKKLAEKVVKDVQNSYVKNSYNQQKVLLAQKTFNLYSEQVRNTVSKLYGPKYIWLFDVGVLTTFTTVSMQSEYQNKPVLLKFTYLTDYIPYDMPTSVISSLSNVVSVKEGDLNSAQVELLKEASLNIIGYFSNPENYSPPATIKSIVGKWEGRISEPNGIYHKASLIVNPDLTGILNAEEMFNNMPVKSIELTQSAVSFNIKPFDDEKLIIKFSGRLADDMMTGEAVDIAAKKGLWQFLKTSQVAMDDVNVDKIENNPAFLDKLVGVWKGKILEENGAISDSTLYFNLVDDSVLVVENDNSPKSLKIKSIAANNDAIKFSVSPGKNDEFDITFLGKIKGRILEGNAKANDGTRGYWKLIKVSDQNLKKNDEAKINNKLKGYNTDVLCDPIVSDSYGNMVIFVDNKPVVVPNIKLYEGKYKGYLMFGDGSKADLTLNLSNNKSTMLLSSSEDNSDVSLDLQDLNITDREITFKTKMKGLEDTIVLFKGRIFGDYISGKAINASGQELKWELIAIDKAKSMLSDVKSSDTAKVMGKWTGKASFAGLTELPLIVNIDNSTKNIKLGNNEPLELSKVMLDENAISFIATKNNDPNPVFIFNGNIEGKNIVGKIATTDGLALSVDLSLDKPVNEDISGIWEGKIHSGNTSADIIFDFTTDKKKIFVDDAKVTTGRLELEVNSFNKADNTIKFKAVTPKSPTQIEFVATIKDSKLQGVAQNQIDKTKKLTWSASKSNLTEYVPQKVAVKKNTLNKPTIQKTFSFLDELKEAKMKISESKISSVPKDEQEVLVNKPKNPDSQLTETISPKENTSDPAAKVSEELKDTKINEISTKDNVKSNEKASEDKTKAPKEEKVKEEMAISENKISDEKKDTTPKKRWFRGKTGSNKELSSESSVKKDDKTLDNKPKDEKIAAERSKTQKDKEIVKTDKTEVKDIKTPEKDNKQIASETKENKDKEIAKTVENKETIEPRTEKITDEGLFKKSEIEKSLKEQKELENKSPKELPSEKINNNQEPKVAMTDKEKTASFAESLLGNWVGEVTNPDQQKGEIILEIKKTESFIYVNREGKKVTFKLFDFNVNNKKVSFKLKSTAEDDGGIMFKGSLKQNTLSGVTVDPDGARGKWFARKL